MAYDDDISYGNEMPQLSYSAAMRLPIDNTIVQFCGIARFRALVEEAALTVAAADWLTVKRRLLGLDFYFREDRWWALLVLTEHNAQLPWSDVEATA